MARKSRFKGVVKSAGERESQGSQFGHLKLPEGVRVFQEHEGVIMLDVIPYIVTDEKHPERDDQIGAAVPGEIWHRRPYHLHRNVGVENENYVCPKSVGQRCPICEYMKRKQREGADWETELKSMKPSYRHLYIVIPRGEKEYEETMHIWSISYFNFGVQINGELEDRDEYEVYPDPELGYRLRVRFDKQSLGGNPFQRAGRIDFESRDPLDPEIVKKAPNLDEVLAVPTYRQLQDAFFAVEGSEGEGKDDTSPPSQDKAKEEDNWYEPPTDRKPKEADTLKNDTPPASDAPTSPDCPYGHTFGMDTDQFPEDCDTCTAWNECTDAKEGA